MFAGSTPEEFGRVVFKAEGAGTEEDVTVGLSLERYSSRSWEILTSVSRKRGVRTVKIAIKQVIRVRAILSPAFT